jgi:hypothetical protein
MAHIRRMIPFACLPVRGPIPSSFMAVSRQHDDTGPKPARARQRALHCGRVRYLACAYSGARLAVRGDCWRVVMVKYIDRLSDNSGRLLTGDEWKRRAGLLDVRMQTASSGPTWMVAPEREIHLGSVPSLPPQQLRQLGDGWRRCAGLVTREQLGRAGPG